MKTKQEAQEYWLAYFLPKVENDPYWQEVSWVSFLDLLRIRHQITTRQMNLWSKTIPENK